MKTAVKKIEKWYMLLLIVAIIAVIFLTTSVFETLLEAQQVDELEEIALIIGNAIDTSIQSENLIQSFWIDKLEGLSQEIEVLIDPNTITSEELETIRQTFHLSGIALFKATEETIVIEKSTTASEIGLETKEWGFWHQAFQSLIDGRPVTIDRGVSRGKFWAGPRSLSLSQEGFYLFTYYALEGTPYLLNLYVDDQEAFGLLKESDPNRLIDDIIQKYDYLSELAVVNVEAWNNRFLEENRFKLQDFTIHYGQYSSFAPEDTYYLNRANDGKVGDTVKTRQSDGKVKLYKKIGDHTVVILLMNQESIAVLKNSMMLTILLGLLSIISIGVLLIKVYTNRYSELLEIERLRLETAERYKQTVKLLPGIVFRFEVEGTRFKIVHCEGKAISVLGVDSTQTQERYIEDVLPKNYCDAIQAHLPSDTFEEFELTLEDKVFHHHMEKVGDNEAGNAEVLLFANDVTRLRASEEEARYLAYHDSLTQLPNRLYLKRVLEERIAEEKPFSVAFLDMDGFKEVNDTAGHDVGDDLIVEVSRRILTVLQPADFCARMGGDEFAIIIAHDSEAEDVRRTACFEALKEVLAKPYRIRSYAFTLTASMGISQFPKDGRAFTTLLKHADIALYKVKDAGKNGYQYYL